ncbi:MAG TPA: precorrin-6A/cobalt-precorrin-6A reductase, partial [Coleofasciculaceae cyanobacterium]
MVVDSINLGFIWLIGGTGESAELANQLTQAGIPVVVTVTTESARSLYPALPRSQVWIGRLTPETIRDFIQTHQICKILDASHPFAVEISQLAIATATQLNLPYLRFERPSLKRESADPLIELDT